MRFVQAAGLLWLAACGSPLTQPEATIPDLPAIEWEAFQSTIRERIEKAYKAVESEPRSPRANGDLAMILHAHQQPAGAEVCYERARLLKPDKFEWAYLLAIVQAEQGKTEAAIENLRRALEIDPGYVPAKLQLGDILLRDGEFEAAASLYREALDGDPRSALAHYGLGRALSSQGKTEEAAEAFRKAIEIHPNYGQAHYALALAYRKLRLADKAKPHFGLGEQHKLETPPADDPVLTTVRRQTQSPTEYLRAGVELDRQGRLEESLALHLQVLDIAPRQAQAHINLISLYWRLGQREKAIEHYEKALKINENLPDCHYNYGVMMFNLQRFDEAKRAFEKAVEINPFYAKAHHNLGVMLEAEGKLDEAAAEYRLAIENQPEYRLARFHLGRVLVNQGRPREAIEQFQQIIEPKDQDAAGFLYALAIAHARAGERGDAIKHMRGARDLAASFDQWDLLSSIKRDLATLEGKHEGR